MSIRLVIEKNSHKLCFHKMELAVFPLNGAVLFPGTSLPLNIFENRYIEMINYSLARDRLIGMIQTNEKGMFYEVGCVGKIHSFNETGDGRYLISLQGTKCFKVISELKPIYSFRLVEANILENKKEEYVFSDKEKSIILQKYKDYMKAKKIELNLQEIENIETDQIIKFIAMVSPFKDIDKQALLETEDSFDFFKKLLSILELELAGELLNSTIN